MFALATPGGSEYGGSGPFTVVASQLCYIAGNLKRLSERTVNLSFERGNCVVKLFEDKVFLNLDPRIEERAGDNLGEAE